MELAAGWLWLVVAGWAVTVDEGRAAEAAEPGGVAAFAGVAGVLEKNCLACHNPRDAKSGLDLSRRATMLAGGDAGPAVAVGDPAGSLLLQRAREGSMPPINDGPQLSREEIAILSAWIAAGAPWPRGRVLQPPPRAAPLEEGNVLWPSRMTRRLRRCGNSRPAAIRRRPRASRS